MRRSNHTGFKPPAKDEALTVSIGVAIRPDHGDTLDELLAVANEAEHAAKIAGRNTVKMAPHSLARRV